MQILDWHLKVAQEQAAETAPNSKRILKLEEEQEKKLSEFEIVQGCMGQKAESAHVGSKVLPICNVAATALGSPDAGNSSDASLNKKRRAISRMKELLRRAVTTKSEKGEKKPWKVLKFHSRGALRIPSDDMGSYSRISFSWDMSSCSTTSALSPLSLISSTASHMTISKDLKQQLEPISKETSASPRTEEILRRGNWITTDSEYVVLEL